MTLAEILAASPLETSPESCFSLETQAGYSPAGNSDEKRHEFFFTKKRRRRTRKVTEYNGPKVKPSQNEIQRRIAEYSTLVAKEIPLPVLPEFKDCFDAD